MPLSLRFIVFSPGYPTAARRLRNALADPVEANSPGAAVPVHPDQEGLSAQLALGKRTPEAAVIAPVAIVAHHVIVPFGDGPFALGRIADGKLGFQHLVGALAARDHLVEQQRAAHLLATAPALVAAGRYVLEGLAVDGHRGVLIAHGVARHADHALDPVLVGILRRPEHHHVAALRLADRHHLLAGDRQAQPDRKST